MKKRTLLISEIFPPKNGGSGRWFWELYGRLPRDEYLIAAGDIPEAQTFDQSHDLKIFRLDLSSLSWGLVSLAGLTFYFKNFLKLRKLIKQENIKAIHCGRCLPEGVLGFMLAKWFKLPFLTYIHGEDIEAASLSRELSLLVSIVLKSTTTLICNSQNTANLVTEKWGIIPQKITVLHPGVDSSHFVPIPDCSKTREQLNWTNKKVILTVGRLQKRKGHDKMIEAMPLILEKIPNAHYAIVGDGQERQTLKELSEKLRIEKHVKFLGEPNDEILVKAYQQCDLFILANRTEGADIEGFGMVLVEAQACGKPVIAGDSGGTKETMRIGETGFIIDCTNSAIIAEKVSSLLENKKQQEQMGLAARKHVVEILDWQAHTEKAKQIFSPEQ